MQVKGIEPDKVREIVSEVSRRYFAGNLGFNRTPERWRGSVRFTLRVADSRGPGHRRGFCRNRASGKARRLVAACYHAYGEVIRGLIDGGAVWVKTAPIMLQRYRSKGEKPRAWDRGTWIDHARDMAEVNIGSTFEPLYFADACDCGEGMMPENPIKYPASPDFFEKGQTSNGQTSGLTKTGVSEWPIVGA